MDVSESRGQADRFIQERVQPMIDKGVEALPDPSNATPPTREAFYELHDLSVRARWLRGSGPQPWISGPAPARALRRGRRAAATARDAPPPSRGGATRVAGARAGQAPARVAPPLPRIPG